MKLEYKPIAVQDECWGGTQKDPRMWVLVKYEAQSKSRRVKFDVMAFPNPKAMADWLEETKLPVVPEAELKPGIGHAVKLLSRASSKQL
jgi:hypothetical protein